MIEDIVRDEPAATPGADLLSHGEPQLVRYTDEMRARDTSAAAEASQLAAYRRMSGTQRVEIAANLSEDVREIARAGIRARHPDYDEELVRLALYRMLLGDELFHRAWPRAPRLEP